MRVFVATLGFLHASFLIQIPLRDEIQAPSPFLDLDGCEQNAPRNSEFQIAQRLFTALYQEYDSVSTCDDQVDVDVNARMVN
jgi:hypothetical protein